MTRRDELAALDAQIKAWLNDPDAKDRAPLVSRRLEILAQLEGMADAEEGDPVEQLLAGVEARGPGSVSAIAAGRRGQQRRRGGRAAS